MKSEPSMDFPMVLSKPYISIFLDDMGATKSKPTSGMVNRLEPVDKPDNIKLYKYNRPIPDNIKNNILSSAKLVFDDPEPKIITITADPIIIAARKIYNIKRPGFLFRDKILFLAWVNIR
jgi:hypothetical protein